MVGSASLPLPRWRRPACLYFNGQRFQLLAWAVMPNHVHVLVQIWHISLAKLLHSWKGFIAREASKLLQRDGPFWQREYWDTYMRSEEQSSRAVRYIEQNPLKAKLVNQAKDWLWSSARFRDPYGKLVAQGGPERRLIAVLTPPPTHTRCGRGTENAANPSSAPAGATFGTEKPAASRLNMPVRWRGPF